MVNSVIWLHEDALRITHPVMNAAPSDARVIYIWDDAYLQAVDYSLKRLVFIYETLCALPLDILHGDTLKILRTLGAGNLYVPATLTPALQKIIHTLSLEMVVNVVADEPFVHIQKPREYRRFFHYWGRAEKHAFIKNGGMNA